MAEQPEQSEQQTQRMRELEEENRLLKLQLVQALGTPPYPQVEDALRATISTLQFYAQLVDNSPDPMMVIDRTFTFLAVNDAYAEVTGVPREQIIGQQANVFLGEEEFEKIIHPMLERALAGECVQYEKWFDFPTIGRRYLEVRYFPLRGKAQVEQVAVVLRDITQRRQAEEALRDSEDRFRAFSEATTDGILLHDKGVIVEANQAIAEHLGYTIDELHGIPILDVVAPQSRDLVTRHMQAGDAGPYEAYSLHKDGSISVGEIRARNIVYKGQALRVAAVREISELKKAQERLQVVLRNTEEWAAEMDATINSIPDGYIVYNPDGTIRRINLMAIQMLGINEDDLQRSYEERMRAMHMESLDGGPVTIEEMPATRALHGETVRGMVIVLREQQHTIWLSVSASPILVDDRMVGVVMEFSDITEVHHLQQQRELYTHTISHDLRAPLTTIQGHAQLLQNALEEEHLDDALRISTAAILRSAQRMNVMIQDLVDIARLESGQIALSRQTVNLTDYLNDMMERAAAMLDVSRLQVDCPPELPPVYADYDRLERILMNLLSNAFKYSTPGTPVRLRARQQGNAVVISLMDEGPGIAPEDVPHLFQRFYRAHGERKAEGLGLGLYITRMLVEAHQGCIWVESTLGHGSTFSFTLPIAKAGK